MPTNPIAKSEGQNPILPRDSVAGNALLIVIAIMSFLAALTVGGVFIVHAAAAAWRGEVSREMTIQVRPLEGRDFEADIRKVAEIARNTPGVADIRVYTKEEAEKLLEPWLGKDADFTFLPVPRLIRMRLENLANTDLSALRNELSKSGASATLDDHRSWSSRLETISRTMIFIGVAILVLVLAATMLSVSFATRGAVAANRTVVEVLHFVGARDSYIANAFQRHFFAVGLKGGFIGGLVAAFLFALSRFAANLSDRLPGVSDAALFLGNFNLGAKGYLAILATAAFVAVVTGLSSWLTVHRTLRTID